MKIVVLGLSITSSWGNGHATTYRGLLRELARRGHDVLFLERDAPWYVENRDLPHPPYCQLELYNSIRELKSFIETISEADAVIIGSYVPEGTEAAEWVLKNAGGVVAFYDIDTPVTLSKLASGECNYLSPELIPEFDLYLSFTGGPTLRLIEETYGAPSAKALYCSVDSGELLSRAARASVGPRLPWHLQRRPAADVESATRRSRGHPAELALCSRWSDVSQESNLAGQRPSRHPPQPLGASGILQRAAVHPEHHAPGHGGGRLVAQRPALRGGGLRHADDQRCLGRDW